MNRPLVFAHRGARRIAPENTLHAFQAALDSGADGIELDVILSADGIPVVIHDFDLSRTTNGNGDVRALRLTEIRELDAGSSFGHAFEGSRIPTLDEVFDSFGRKLSLNVEVKDWTIRRILPQKVVSLIEKYELEADMIISSFNPFMLRYVKELKSTVRTGYLVTPRLNVMSGVGRIIAGMHDAVHPHFSTLSRERVNILHEAGYAVHTWTVNEPDAIRLMAEFGVDMIITDVPDIALQALT